MSFTKAQQSAIDHKNGSDLLISAGAGSGKTTTLINRIVKKLKEKDDNGNFVDDISKKLIVTFTIEAANKLKSDITDLLAKALSEEKDEATIKHLQSQIVKVNSADISTIHSFCLKLVRAHFDMLPLDGDFKIGDENEVEYIKNEVMKEVVEELFENGTPGDDILLVNDFYSVTSDADSLSSNLLKLYQKLSKTSKFLDTLLISQNKGTDFLDTVYGEFLVDKLLMLIHHYRPIFEKVITEIKACDSGSPKYLVYFVELLNHLNELELAVNSHNYTKTKRLLDEFKTNVTVKNFPSNFKKESNIGSVEYKELIDSIRKDFNKERNALIKYDKKYKNENCFEHSAVAVNAAFNYNLEICKALYNILSLYEKRFTERKRKYGICELDDIEKLAHILLVGKCGKPSKIARKIANDYNEVYIDEYQDTNSVQDEIFAAISNNNRFMVGDVKQSIYRFRAAEPEIFSSYRKKFVEITPENKEDNQGKIIYMSENFRCDENIIKFSNAVSNYMFMPATGVDFKLGIPYSKEDALIFSKDHNDTPITNEKCEVCIIDRMGDEFKELEKKNEHLHCILQAKYVASRIKKIKDYIESEEPVNTKGEKLKLSDVAILLRKRKYISYYTEALKELGIDTEYIEKVPFFEKPHILILLSLLNIVDNPYKEEYLIGALLSSVFNFSFDDLYKIRKGDFKMPLYSALNTFSGDEDIEKKIKEFKNKLEQWQKETGKMNACEAVNYVMNASNLIMLANDNEKRDLIKLYNKAREYEQGSYKGLYKFLTHIESIKDTEEQEAVFTSPENCIKIMTMHTAKGLQFEYCFVCNLEGAFSFMDTNDDILFNRHLGVAGYVGNKGGLVKYNTILKKISKYAIKKSSIDEEMCLLYVAMTRAQRKLIITGSIDDFNKKRAELEDLAQFQSKYDLYSSKNLLEFIMKALASNPLSCVEYGTIDQTPFKPYLDSLKSPSLPKVDELNEDEMGQLEEEKQKRIDALRDILRNRFDFKYKYEHLNKLPSKVSVSSLKKNGLLDSLENDDIDLTKDLSKRPKFMSIKEDAPSDVDKDEEATGADKGTATHLFMQFCNFENLEANGYEAELTRLKESAFISENDIVLINKEDINAFASKDPTSLFQMMKRADKEKKLWREFRFNVLLPVDKNLSSDPELQKEKVLVQGVVDAVFIDENNQLILLDYKTDRLNIAEVTDEKSIFNIYRNVLTRRYENQLKYYKKAMELIFERKVDKTYIYSVPLAKEVEIE